MPIYLAVIPSFIQVLNGRILPDQGQAKEEISIARDPLSLHGPLACPQNYGRMFQNAALAIARAFLLSADVPGVNCPLSPAELNEAACC